MTHLRVWRFEPAAGRVQQFAEAYAGDGVWAQLFRRADGFFETRLLAPAESGGPWLTLDRWQSRSAFERFEETHREAYRALDAELLHLTSGEQFIGAFEEADA